MQLLKIYWPTFRKQAISSEHLDSWVFIGKSGVYTTVNLYGLWCNYQSCRGMVLFRKCTCSGFPMFSTSSRHLWCYLLGFWEADFAVSSQDCLHDNNINHLRIRQYKQLPSQTPTSLFFLLLVLFSFSLLAPLSLIFLLYLKVSLSLSHIHTYTHTEIQTYTDVVISVSIDISYSRKKQMLNKSPFYIREYRKRMWSISKLMLLFEKHPDDWVEVA